MDLLTECIKDFIDTQMMKPLEKGDLKTAAVSIANVQVKLYESIPENKRISFGRYFTVKILAKYIFEKLNEENIPVFDTASAIFEKTDNYFAKGVSLGVLSYYGLDDYSKVLPYFEKAGKDEHWDMREFAAGLFRKLIRKHPENIKDFLSKLVNSDDPLLKRLAAESLRPAAENRWIHKNPEYSLSVLKELYKEKSPYPRTSVGNNLSDLARKNPELIYSIVEKLVSSGDKNSYWIAYRACRNLVKAEPLRVMDLLRTDEYKYKNRVHKRSEYNRN